MTVIKKILVTLLLMVFMISLAIAGGLFWDLNFGDCQDGCDGGMAFIFFLPALIVTGISGACLALTYKSWRKKNSDRE